MHVFASWIVLMSRPLFCVEYIRYGPARCAGGSQVVFFRNPRRLISDSVSAPSSKRVTTRGSPSPP
eukprot:3911942-Prymnesium_polylepis.1